jgi:hypothetical protein
MHGYQCAGVVALINAGMLTATPGCASLGAGQDAGPLIELDSVYELPERLELHYPYLVLHADGKFAFVAAPEDAGFVNEYENHGVYRLTGDALRLTYEDATCCQFMDFDEETLQITAANADDTLTAAFRDETVTLKRIGPIPAH